MATWMTVGMAAWMAWKRHSWPGIVEMGLAMYLAFRAELSAEGLRMSLLRSDGAHVPTGLPQTRTHGDLDGLLGQPQPDTRSTAAGPNHCSTRSSNAAPPGPRDRCTSSGSSPNRSPSRAARGLRRPSLTAIEEAGVGVLSSCAEGTCGTCEASASRAFLIIGTRYSIRTPGEERCAMICVSRACTPRFVLDI